MPKEEPQILRLKVKREKGDLHEIRKTRKGIEYNWPKEKVDINGFKEFQPGQN